MDGPAVVAGSKARRASGLPRPSSRSSPDTAAVATPRASSRADPAAKGDNARKRREKDGGGDRKKGKGKKKDDVASAGSSDMGGSDSAADVGPRRAKARAGPHSDKPKQRGGGPEKGRGKSPRSPPSSDRKKKGVVSSKTRFWIDFDQPGNAFLRDCLGGAGAGSSAKSDWEYTDIAKALGQAKYSGIQAFYNGVAGEMMNDKTYVDVADMLGIPTRAFIIPTLLKGFETLLASGKLQPWTPAAGADPPLNHTHTHGAISPLVTLETRTDFKRAATPPIIDPNVAPGSRPKNNKTWKELQTEAGNKKQESKSCSIM